eukprot:15461764-Alexandrium_andersonii.AAC.1
MSWRRKEREEERSRATRRRRLAGPGGRGLDFDAEMGERTIRCCDVLEALDVGRRARVVRFGVR